MLNSNFNSCLAQEHLHRCKFQCAYFNLVIHDFEIILFACILEVQEMAQTLPSTCRVDFKDPDQLHTFHLIITPKDGLWSSGVFKFQIDVPLNYNNEVSIYYYIDEYNLHYLENKTVHFLYA